MFIKRLINFADRKTKKIFKKWKKKYKTDWSMELSVCVIAMPHPHFLVPVNTGVI